MFQEQKTLVYQVNCYNNEEVITSMSIFRNGPCETGAHGRLDAQGHCVGCRSSETVNAFWPSPTSIAQGPYQHKDVNMAPRTPMYICPAQGGR